MRLARLRMWRTTKNSQNVPAASIGERGLRLAKAHPETAMTGRAIALRLPRPRRAGGTNALRLPVAALNAARTAQRAVPIVQAKTPRNPALHCSAPAPDYGTCP